MVLLPVGVDYEARRQPVVTFTLIGINVLVFVLEVLTGLSGDGNSMIMTYGLVPASHGWWAWLTSTFLHGGLFHLLGNMVYLYLFGACVEDIMGRGKFVVFYLTGGIVANIIQVMFTTSASADIPVVGASGAISACIGAFLVVLPKTEINFWYMLFWIKTGEFALRSRVVIGAWFVMDLISFFLELNDPSKSGEVAVGAHVGGTVAGFVAMLLLRGSLNKADEEPVRLAPAPVKAEGLTCLDLLGVQPVYLSVGGQQAGPYPPEAIQGMIDCQSLPEGAYFWQEGMAEWRPVTELLGSPA